MLRNAQAQDATALTRIAFAAKRHWNYPPDWIERWSGELTITADYLAAHRVRCWLEDGQLVGFYSIVTLAGDCRFGNVTMERGYWLDHMFIDPAWHGRGIGRSFFLDIDEWLGGPEAALGPGLRIFVDPHAEGFYRKLGCVPLRESDSSIPGRRIQVYGYRPLPSTRRLRLHRP